MSKEETTYGVIQEVGNIGLGFDELNEQDNKKLNENAEEERKDKKDK